MTGAFSPARNFSIEINQTQFKTILAGFPAPYSKNPEDYTLYSTGALFELMPYGAYDGNRYLVGLNMGEPSVSLSHPLIGTIPSFQGRFDGLFTPNIG